jgi:hypothetical protein
LTYSATSSSSEASSSTPTSQARASSTEVTERDRHVEQVLDPPDQGQRGLRARRLGDVVRNRCPERGGRDAESRTGVLEHADDAGQGPRTARVPSPAGLRGRHRYRCR